MARAVQRTRADVGAQSRRRRGNSVNRQVAAARPSRASSWEDPALALAAARRVRDGGGGLTGVLVDASGRGACCPQTEGAAGRTKRQRRGGRGERSCHGRTAGGAVVASSGQYGPVSYTHLRAHETPEHLVCRLLLEK